MITTLFNLFDALWEPLNLEDIPLRPAERDSATKESIYQGVVYQLEGEGDIEASLSRKRWYSPVALLQTADESQDWHLRATPPAAYDGICRILKKHECTNN